MCGAEMMFRSPCVGSCTSMELVDAISGALQQAVHIAHRNTTLHLLAPQQRHAPQAEGGQLAVTTRIVPLLPVLPVRNAEICDVVNYCQALQKLPLVRDLWQRKDRMCENAGCFSTSSGHSLEKHVT
jgi:hypothetical protein